jgi:cytochrome c-type biogenesis protein CcmH
VIRALLVLVATLALAPAAAAGESHPTLGELEGEVMCPVCGTTLDQSNSPAAVQIKRLIARRIAAGDTKNEIKDRLVAEYGDAILAAPPKEGLGLLAWWLPLAGIVVAATLLGFGAWRWTRAREPPLAGGALDPAVERRVDDELRRFEG